MPTDRERSLTNRRVPYVGGGEAVKGKESVKGEEKVKDNPVSEGDRKQPMLLRDISEEGATEADQKVKVQEGYKEEG